MYIKEKEHRESCDIINSNYSNYEHDYGLVLKNGISTGIRNPCHKKLHFVNIIQTNTV